MDVLEPENPYCMRCSKHLGLMFHETNEHDRAVELLKRNKV